MENGDYKIKNEGRLTKLESSYNFLTGEIKDIKNNHLKHLKEKMDKMQWLLITTLIAVLLTFISKFIK